ncbi:hypothetical protein SERLA73DRAFT_125910 [Serpula lacrymans var. lacrymans S7.3]|uniref:NAD(P)-binding protein n=2 Tax=Serpula lacrymans var. lacrymans TaxID=341189 RepID=F8QB22_SERL3|nr:uncharacterized protein SERLADRAFT_373950 [Serpula lacrymans var. lacrymans S7.9]EGN94408.1 hypothetical protein SERLA73DRAFT_125910 [Serpula lacrymans var. lacrymans S7.3]EGO19889.1 hypothetical protein SERLADRAFT_373950 [Serpula lacrymans var. lacrymans S7.9]
MSSAPKIWFITGASTGFGRSMTEHLLNKGDIVIATLRKPSALSDLSSKYPATRLLVLKLDVTDQNDITAAFEKARTVYGRIDVVFNNAGVVLVSEIEGTSDEAARSNFEVNFWGAANVSKKAVEFFREVNKPKGGRLLQVTSGCGIKGHPGVAFYSASKFALEGFSESLSKELDPRWDIKVTIIEPGAFRTNVNISSNTTEPVHPAYTDPSLESAKMRTFLAAGHALIDGDPDKAVAVIEKVVHLDDPPMRLPVHKGALAMLREKVRSMIADANKYESWSDDVCVTGANA